MDGWNRTSFCFESAKSKLRFGIEPKQDLYADVAIISLGGKNREFGEEKKNAPNLVERKMRERQELGKARVSEGHGGPRRARRASRPSTMQG